MVQLVCSGCTFRTTAPLKEGFANCPVCGAALTDIGGGRLGDVPAEDEQLINDVREAFESCSLRIDGPASPASAETVGTAVAPPAVGTRLGDFEILGEIGRGGMGIVYRARQTALNRTVALKVLPASAHRRQSTARRFQTEAQAVARLNHPNVVPIFAEGHCDGHRFYAMELIEGISLDLAIHRRPELLSSASSRGSFETDAGNLPLTSSAADSNDADYSATNSPEEPEAPLPNRTLADFRHLALLVAGAAEGLAHAFDRGVIHRDVKPNNLLLGSDGRLHITDFGLAHLEGEPHETMAGEVIGTAVYLSPEQVRGDACKVDHRTDVYSLGATLYELLTHNRPFGGKSRDQILLRICTEDARRPRDYDPRIPQDLETICLRAMEKAPARRFATTAEMAEDLHRFAEGRPILSRRVGPLEIATKWARRHRAATVALVGLIGLVALAAGMVRSERAARRGKAAGILQAAYSKLAYLDYRHPELLEDSLREAENLGADPQQLALARALASLGAQDQAAARTYIDQLLERNPSDTRALYLRAWERWRSGAAAESLRAFADAEALGGPTGADGWFFRGLAAHFSDPDVAIESYEEANAWRSRQRDFYPQAVLHLARAHNQQLYASRDAESFVEAEASLLQLIEHGHYDAYPYYLLSIAHRLMAETCLAQGTSMCDADMHFEEALSFARSGQEYDPADDRPVTAEAECLESMGWWKEAAEARTRAISLASTPLRRWEGHHYRWRLFFWMGRYDDALWDLEACLTWSPEPRFYRYVYPAFVHAARDDISASLEAARGLTDADDKDGRAILWSASCLRLLGHGEEADRLLAGWDCDAITAESNDQQWLRALCALSHGEIELADAVAVNESAESPRGYRAEALFHTAVEALASGDRTTALDLLTKAQECYDGELGYTYHAKVIRERMRGLPDWPRWVPTTSGDYEPEGHEECEAR